MQKKRSILPFVIFAALIICAAGAFLIGNHFRPGTQRYNLNTFFGISNTQDVALMVDHVLLEEQAVQAEDSVYLPLDTVQKYICSRFYFDEELQQVIYVKPEGPQFLSDGVKIDGEEISIRLDVLTAYAQIACEEYQNPHRLIISTRAAEKNFANVKSGTQIRYRAGIKSPVLKDTSVGETLEILDTVDDWTHVVSADGCIGYIRTRYLSDAYQDTITIANADQVYSSFLRNEKICLAWHQMSAASGNAELKEKLAHAKGVNVISPTWFFLTDGSGTIQSLADQNYVDICHGLGIEVWALFENFTYDADVREALPFYSRRQHMIDQIVSECVRLGIDGVNLDFEGLPEDTGEAYVEFVRELSVRCHENGLVLSVDNYVPYNFNSFYGRKEQAVFADYVIVMSYDEHLNAETGAGSVASLEYTDYAIRTMLEEVPKEKLINGVPFYTRLWIDTPKTDAEIAAENASEAYSPYTLSWQTLGMADTQTFLNGHGMEPAWDAEAGQYYAEKEENGTVYRIWVEDGRSLEEKLMKIQSYDIAGMAAWRLGFETEDCWDVIVKYYPE